MRFTTNIVNPSLLLRSQEAALQEEEEEEEEGRVKDPFLRHKFCEVEEEFEDVNIELQQQFSPNSRNRQSMSRRFKSNTPERADRVNVPETPKSKVRYRGNTLL